jgi:hypothetical protein
MKWVSIKKTGNDETGNIIPHSKRLKDYPSAYKYLIGIIKTRL